MIRVLIADDHPALREGLKRILSQAGDVVVVAEAGTAAETIARAREAGRDVAITDLSMPGAGGLELLAALRRAAPGLRILVLTVHDEPALAARALRAGAAGYITKESAPDELVRAVRLVAAGGRYVSPAVAERLDTSGGAGARHDHLSEREFQVLRLLAAGHSLKAMASQLSLSAKTVSTYRARLLAKLGMRTTAELIGYAIRNGLAEDASA